MITIPRKFIVVEGPNGSGKSTVISGLEKLMCENDIGYKRTHEPGGGPEFAAAVRHWLKSGAINPTQHELVMGFMFCRSLNLTQTVVPSLQSGKVVICDRFLKSTHVYQGCMGGIPEQDINMLYEFVSRPFKEIIDKNRIDIVLDATPETTAERMNIRMNSKQEKDRFEGFAKLECGAYAQVHSKYEKHIDANRPPQAVLEDVIAAVTVKQR
ncbi:MAG: deoxynucleoside kinase [Alphaproteobacteria bacterium]|nr:deoxynucleoside kinase [Alphaproteobacteria bacterium]